MDKATSEGDEHQDTQAVETDAGGPKQPEGTEDIQPAVPEPVKEAPSTEAQVRAVREVCWLCIASTTCASQQFCCHLPAGFHMRKSSQR